MSAPTCSRDFVGSGHDSAKHFPDYWHLDMERLEYMTSDYKGVVKVDWYWDACRSEVRAVSCFVERNGVDDDVALEYSGYPISRIRGYFWPWQEVLVPALDAMGL